MYAIRATRPSAEFCELLKKGFSYFPPGKDERDVSVMRTMTACRRGVWLVSLWLCLCVFEDRRAAAQSVIAREAADSVEESLSVSPQGVPKTTVGQKHAPVVEHNTRTRGDASQPVLQSIDSLLEQAPHAYVLGDDDDSGCIQGNQLVELDVCLTPEQASQFEPVSQDNNSDRTSGKRRRKRQAMAVAAFPIWKGGVIPYIFNLSFSASDRNLVLAAMAEWELVTCVRFRPATAQDADLVIFRDGTRCSTNIGRVGGHQVLTLAQPCRTKRILIHELGHVLGLIHEHQRHDRDNYVHVLLQNVRNSTQERYQFSKLSPRPLTDGQVEYSYTSIMHYGRNYFAKHPDLTTLQTRDPRFQNIIGRAEAPSTSDAETINLLYACEGTFQNRLPDATCDLLLRTGKCDGKVRDTIRPLCSKSCQLHHRQNSSPGSGDLFQPPSSAGLSGLLLPQEHGAGFSSLKSDATLLNVNVIGRLRASSHGEVIGTPTHESGFSGRGQFPQVASWLKHADLSRGADHFGQTDSAIQRVKTLVEQSQQRGAAVARNAEEHKGEINAGGNKPGSWMRPRQSSDYGFQGNAARFSTTTSDPRKPRDRAPDMAASYGAENSPMAAANMMALSPEFLPESSLTSALRAPPSPRSPHGAGPDFHGVPTDHKVALRSWSPHQAQGLPASLLSLVVEAVRASARTLPEGVAAKQQTASGAQTHYSFANGGPRMHPTDRMGPDTHANLQP